MTGAPAPPFWKGQQMPTRGQFRLTLSMLVLWTAAMCWPRLWAARHAAEGDTFECVADAINVAA